MTWLKDSNTHVNNKNSTDEGLSDSNALVSCADIESIIKPIKSIQKTMEEFARYWGIKGIVGMGEIEKLKGPYSIEKRESEFDGFKYEWAYQYQQSDAGDDYFGEIFLPLSSRDFLRIEWSS